MATYSARFSGRNIREFAQRSTDLDITGDPQSDNDARASFAAVALDAFTTRAGEGDSDSDFCDLLADLMHLADAMGVDFDVLFDRAERNYRREVAGL